MRADSRELASEGNGVPVLLHCLWEIIDNSDDENLRSSMSVIVEHKASQEEFTNEFANSIHDGKGDSFRKRYREMGIFPVDDIQFLANKESTSCSALT